MRQRKTKSRFKAPLIGYSIALIILSISFQNFSSIPLGILNPHISTAEARAVSPSDGSADIRKLAPQKPVEQDDPIVATPQSGGDLDSVSQDWMSRETHLITGGAEQKVLDKMNRRMSRWLASTPDEKAQGPQGQPGNGSTSALQTPSEPEGGLLSIVQPKSVRFTKMNQMDMSFENDAHLSCLFRGDSMQLDLSKNVIGNVDVNLRHDTHDDANSVHLKYSW